MNPIPIIWCLGAILAVGGLVFYKMRFNKAANGKKLLFLGPEESGKTTLYNWFTKNQPTTNYTASGDKNDYEDPTHQFVDEKHKIRYADMGGSDWFLNHGEFEKHYKENDILIFVFDVKKYLNDNGMRDDVNARIDFMYTMEKHSREKKKCIVFVGSHIDQLDLKKTEIEVKLRESVGNKEYSVLLQNNGILLADLTKKSSAIKVLKECIIKMEK